MAAVSDALCDSDGLSAFSGFEPDDVNEDRCVLGDITLSEDELSDSSGSLDFSSDSDSDVTDEDEPLWSADLEAVDVRPFLQEAGPVNSLPSTARERFLLSLLH